MKRLLFAVLAISVGFTAGLVFTGRLHINTAVTKNKFRKTFKLAGYILNLK